MRMSEEILLYIKEKYHPLSILVYGSYSDGTNNQNSDFDCMAIVKNRDVRHDASVVGGVQLDLFLYTEEEIRNIEDAEDFVQLFDAEVICDTDGLARSLVDKVKQCVEKSRVTTEEAKEMYKAWLEKMLRRTQRHDTEGLFRHHWALTDSLEIYCNLRDIYYFGPKKTIIYLQNNDTKGHELLQRALETVDVHTLRSWIEYVITGKKELI